MIEKTDPWSVEEEEERLKRIARDGSNAAAAIAAMKMLREMAEGKKPSAAGFAALDELAEPRRARVKAA